MRIVRRVLVVALGLLVVLAIAVLNVLQSIELTDRITLITPRLPALGANMLVYRNAENTIVVDSQLSALSALVGIRVGGLDEGDPIVITHWHPDHSGGFSAFSEVVVLRLTRDALAAI